MHMHMPVRLCPCSTCVFLQGRGAGYMPNISYIMKLNKLKRHLNRRAPPYHTAPLHMNTMLHVRRYKSCTVDDTSSHQLIHDLLGRKAVGVCVCRFCFCRYHGMVPLRFCPMMPAAMSHLINRFTASADMKTGTRELRTGMVFGRVMHAQLHHGGQENRGAICIGGQWSVNSNTYQNDYLHPAFFNAIFGDLVRATATSSA